MNDEERTLVLVALARHAVHIRECIDTCEPGVVAAHRADLKMLDQLFRKIQNGGLARQEIKP